MAEGEEIFGRVCTKREWHNTSSAAKSYGSGPSRMHRLLDGLDIGQKKEGKPRVFQVEDGDKILPDVLRCIPRIECIRRLGVHHDRFDRFVALGVFRPKYQIPKVAPLFDPEDINRFLSEVRANSRQVFSPTKGLLSIKTVCNAAICQFEEILPKLLAGELTKTEWVASERGLHALRLDLEDVRDAIEVKPSPDFSKEQLRSVLCVNGATVKMLIDSNQLKAVQTRHHRSRLPMKVVKKDEVQNFLTKYVSLGELAKKEGIQANWVAARLAKDGIHPISLPSQFSKLYLRQAIQS